MATLQDGMGDSNADNLALTLGAGKYFDQMMLRAPAGLETYRCSSHHQPSLSAQLHMNHHFPLLLNLSYGSTSYRQLLPTASQLII